ncbi:MAG: type I restriction-modification system subunit M N-terminal domain-containing protein [Sulfuricella sp.]
MPNVSNIVKSIQDIMRKDAGTYGDAQRLEQLGWMFSLKIFDDREKELELLRDNYKSPLPKHLRWSAWATDEEGITGQALLDFVNNTLNTSIPFSVCSRYAAPSASCTLRLGLSGGTRKASRNAITSGLFSSIVICVAGSR